MAATLTIPTRPEELEEFLGQPDNVKAMMSEPGKFQEFIKAYAEMTVQKDSTLKQQIKEQVQLGLAEFMQQNGMGGRRLNFSNAADGLTPRFDARSVSMGKAVGRIAEIQPST